MAYIIYNLTKGLEMTRFRIRKYLDKSVGRERILWQMQKCIDYIKCKFELDRKFDCFGTPTCIHLTTEQWNVFNECYKTLRDLYLSVKYDSNIQDIQTTVNFVVGTIEREVLNIKKRGLNNELKTS